MALHCGTKRHLAAAKRDKTDLGDTWQLQGESKHLKTMLMLGISKLNLAIAKQDMASRILTMPWQSTTSPSDSLHCNGKATQLIALPCKGKARRNESIHGNAKATRFITYRHLTLLWQYLTKPLYT